MAAKDVKRVTPADGPNPPLPPVPGGWRETSVTIGGIAWTMTLPAAPDALLDDPSVHEAHARDDYMPYWAYLWPAARKMAEFLLEHVSVAENEPVLELGCGIGLVGLAALQRGAQVTLSDYDPNAVQVAAWNARQNGFDRFTARTIDWRCPTKQQFSMILGCDLLYERRNHASILSFLQNSLAHGGRCWLGEPGRGLAEQFLSEARHAGWDVLQYNERGTQVSGWRNGEFRMLMLQRP